MRNDEGLGRRSILVLPATWIACGAWGQVTERPIYEVGDDWLYDWNFNGNRRRRRFEVVDVSSTGITLGTGPIGALTGREQRSLQLNRMDVDGAEITQVDHPMQAGKRWESEYRAKLADGNGVRTRLKRKVIGTETLQLAGSALECFVIEAEGWWYGDWIGSPFEPPTGPASERYWYSPAAKAIVKFQAETFRPRIGGREQTVDLRYELVSYRVK